jgi:uncharacterized metal-binding protein YceD (DUF177 family)
MLKKEIELKKIVHFEEVYSDLKDYKVNHDLVTSLNEVKVKATLVYHDSIKTLDVSGEIVADFDATDARDGKLLKNNIENIKWNEQYSFEIDDTAPENNVVLGDDFDILGYAIDEIVLNIPINFSKNYDRISIVNEFGGFFEEDEDDSLQDDKIDPRWEKLNDFKFEK